MNIKKEFRYNIELLEHTLDRIIGFIRNCDQKAGILLGVFGAVISILVQQNLFKIVRDTFLILNLHCKFVAILYIIILLLSLFSSFVGLYYLIFALRANIVNNTFVRSLIFFGDIADMSVGEYKTQLNIVSQEKLKEDLIAQIYVNAAICKVKFMAYGKGFKFGLIGVSILIAIVFVSNFINDIVEVII